MTSDLIFDVPTLIETIMQSIILNPVDVIAIGTPASFVIGFKPHKFLSIGDKIAIEIDHLGRLINKIV